MSTLDLQPSGRGRSPAPFHPAISIDDYGLVCGAGSILVRMATAGGKPHLLVEDDAGRLLAMLSAAFNRRVSAAEIVPHVEAASAHWSRGDKALANFRLIFARLPRLRGAVDAERLRLAECALDQSFPPDALVKELGFAAASLDLRRYREDEPRVPAGFGEQSGQWTKDPQFAPTTNVPTHVAEVTEDGPPSEDEKEYETRHLEGATSVQEDLEHGRDDPLHPPELPPGISIGPYAGEPIPAGPGPRPSDAQKDETTVRGYRYGCHTRGTMDPGTPNGRFFCDHQPATALCDGDTPQYYYPQCAACSNRQGGLLRQYLRGKQQ